MQLRAANLLEALLRVCSGWSPASSTHSTDSDANISRFCRWERRTALFCAPGMISLLFYWLVFHAVYLSVRISRVMLSVGAWSGLASIAGVVLLSRISRITLVTRSSGVAFVPPVTSLAGIPCLSLHSLLSLLSGLPLRAILSGRSRLSLRCRCCRCCLLWRCLATAA